jgi:assimilatory nitrate reductase catalytic subunit
MAKLPVDDLAITRAFGPNLSEGTRGGTETPPDKLVKTHCCFCGQQCGIQLKVRGNEVIGFEPWEDFPFNRGMLCPKGVKRYLQGSHPDRLLTALRRDPSAHGGFSSMGYDAAIARVASEIARLQKEHGNGSIGVLGGASLTTEKTYLLGKFARVCLSTPFIDYNGRLCMVSAGAANKKAFGIDRTTNPWSDMVGTEVIWVAGSNVAECSPITTNYIWQAREMGAKVIVQDPRITPIARTCDLYLPVRPGRDAALFAGVLGLMIEQGWIDREFIAEHTTGFEAVADYCKQWPIARTAEVTGVPERSLRARRPSYGGLRSRASCFTRAASSTTRTACRTSLGTINLVLASGRIGKPKVAATGRSSAKRTARADASTARSATSCRAGATSRIPSTASTSPASGDRREGHARSGRRRLRDVPQDRRGEIKGLIAICFNPKISLPDNQFITRALEKLEFYVAIDFFLNDTARHADIVLPGSLQEEDEGTVTQVEGRVIKINKAVDCPGEARQDWRDHPGYRACARPAARVHVPKSRARSSKSCGSRARAASPTTRGSLTRRSTRDGGLLAVLQPRSEDR